MRFLAVLVLLVLGTGASALAQQDTQQLSSRVEKLTALVEQQQKQIEQLQKSQADLLQELRAPKTQGITPSPAPAASTASDTPAATAEPSTAQSAAYDNAPKERGIALGDRVRIGGYGSVRYETNN